MNRESDMKEVANIITMKIINYLMKYYNCSYSRVESMLDKVGYWRILNDDEVACVLAHDFDIHELIDKIERCS